MPWDYPIVFIATFNGSHIYHRTLAAGDILMVRRKLAPVNVGLGNEVKAFIEI